MVKELSDYKERNTARLPAIRKHLMLCVKCFLGDSYESSLMTECFGEFIEIALRNKIRKWVVGSCVNINQPYAYILNEISQFVINREILFRDLRLES